MLKSKKKSFIGRIGDLLVGQSFEETQVMDQLKANLLMADISLNTTTKLLEQLKMYAQKHPLKKHSDVKNAIEQIISNMLTENSKPTQEIQQNHPYVIMVVGVNGVGKTTSVAKLAYYYKRMGKRVVLGASDTFRAAAVEQLTHWAQQIDVRIVKQTSSKDPASVAFDTVSSAKARHEDVVIIDTAGRLHNQVGLMNELSKIKRVIGKSLPSAPHQILLVLDATTGQNGIRQAQIFNQAVNISGLIITKLDGTAKGGIVLSIQHEMNIPICFVGHGEKAHLLSVFEPKTYIKQLIQV